MSERAFHQDHESESTTEPEPLGGTVEPRTACLRVIRGDMRGGCMPVRVILVYIQVVGVRIRTVRVHIRAVRVRIRAVRVRIRTVRVQIDGRGPVC